MNVLHRSCKHSQHAIVESHEAHHYNANESPVTIQAKQCQYVIPLLIFRLFGLSLKSRCCHHDYAHETSENPNELDLQKTFLVDHKSKQNDPKRLSILDYCEHAQRQESNREYIESLANSHHERSITKSKSILIRHSI